ncbi:DUF4209 domain-containing protein [Mucilaginibacter mali]|uniref:DUF4209 domain-containing protein n=1 Tax=Mucilaginibacter mali TaxID=2740462 RepID=A0A7D4UQB4_9SPHI|nr:DUF4209 domain-containing protein [Mucilaginibacter mali]QKJ32440.1 DUF4209 domain-containing protein [Mucilaginibacter mali]
MKKDKVDLKEIKVMSQLYELLEKDALLLTRDHRLLDVLVDYRNQTENTDEKQLAQWELEAFLFGFHGIDPFAYSTSTGAEPGTYNEFPDMDDFQAKAFNYLRQRCVQANNPVLVARYHHLVWRGPKGIKNKAFATRAIDGYMAQVPLYLKQFDIDGDDHSLSEISQLLKKLIRLCAETKFKVDELKKLLSDIFYNTPTVPFFIKDSVLELMLETKVLFRPADFKGALDIYEAELLKETHKKDRFLWTHGYFDNAINLATRLGVDVKIWHERLGDMHTHIAELENKPERNWLKGKAISSAIEAYRNAGHAEKKKNAEQLLFELKPHIKLTSVRIPANDDEIKQYETLQKYIKNECKNLLLEPPEQIYASLIEGWFFPNAAAIGEKVKTIKSTFDLFTVVQFDNNKNIRTEQADAGKNKRFNEAYSRYLEHYTLQYLHYVFVPGIKSGHLTYRNFLAFLKERTWLGEPYLETDLSGNVLSFNWISMLAPAIVEYFVQVQSWVWSAGYTPSFMLPIESLTLKMEGLLRNFAERLNISTTVLGKNGTQEAYIHNILEDERIQTYFDQEDVQFFKFLFANEGGINLRNNIAHCLYNVTDYSLDKMHLLLAALIRIAKYQILKKE